MSMVTIECPKCGGQVKRKKNEYFAFCPYCGAEIGFDEIKEEAQLGKYIERIDTLEKNEQESRGNREQMSKWLKLRNGMLILMTTLNFLGTCVEAGASLIFPNVWDYLTWGALAGVLCAAAVGIWLIGTPIVALRYPCYDVFQEKKEKAGRIKMLLLLAGIGVVLLAISMILALMLIYNLVPFLMTHLT